ncbi:MAG: hypothetical protein AAGG44_00495 [Planctomycetota bacterium]
MKTHALLATLIISFCSTSAYAQRGRGPDIDDVLQLLDLDQDGAISFAEIEQASQMLRSLDRNEDRRISGGELDGFSRRSTGSPTPKSSAPKADATSDAMKGDYFVTSSEDDAEERITHEVNLDSDDLDFGQSSVGGFETAVAIGLRFQGINVTQGSKIKRAYLQFTKDDSPTEAEPTKLTIWAELAPNAAPFKVDRNNITSRSTTRKSIVWEPQPWTQEERRSASQRSPDLSQLVQEVVDQKGWKPGSAVVFVITGTGERDALTFDSEEKGSAPMLHLETE